MLQVPARLPTELCNDDIAFAKELNVEFKTSTGLFTHTRISLGVNRIAKKKKKKKRKKKERKKVLELTSREI
jgi:hypothetical protein